MVALLRSECSKATMLRTSARTGGPSGPLDGGDGAVTRVIRGRTWGPPGGALGARGGGGGGRAGDHRGGGGGGAHRRAARGDGADVGRGPGGVVECAARRSRPGRSRRARPVRGLGGAGPGGP